MSEGSVAVVERISAEEAFGSLTGFDEIAIQQKFGREVAELSQTMTVRAMVFVLKRRAGLDDKDAYGASMRMSLRECKDQFAEDGEEADEGEG